MNIQAITDGTKKYDYLERVQAQLKLLGLQLTDLQSYERIGRSKYGKPDNIYKKRFGATCKFPQHKHTCLCGHRKTALLNSSTSALQYLIISARKSQSLLF